MCWPAPNQLLAYDSHYLHLSQRVSGAQPGLHRQEKPVLLMGVQRDEYALDVQFCRLLCWWELTWSNGWDNAMRLACMCWLFGVGAWGAWRSCVTVDAVNHLQSWCVTRTVRVKEAAHCRRWDHGNVSVSVHACLLILTWTRECACGDWQVGSWERAAWVWIQAWSHAYLMNRLFMKLETKA